MPACADLCVRTRLCVRPGSELLGCPLEPNDGERGFARGLGAELDGVCVCVCVCAGVCMCCEAEIEHSIACCTDRGACKSGLEKGFQGCALAPSEGKRISQGAKVTAGQENFCKGRPLALSGMGHVTMDPE